MFIAKKEKKTMPHIEEIDGVANTNTFIEEIRNACKQEIRNANLATKVDLDILETKFAVTSLITKADLNILEINMTRKIYDVINAQNERENPDNTALYCVFGMLFAFGAFVAHCATQKS